MEPRVKLPGAHRNLRRRGGRVISYWQAWRGGPAIGKFTAANEAELIKAEAAAAGQGPPLARVIWVLAVGRWPRAGGKLLMNVRQHIKAPSIRTHLSSASLPTHQTTIAAEALKPLPRQHICVRRCL